MDYVHAIILAVVQGIAEFLPISSSGHLVISNALLQQFLGSSLPASVTDNATMGIALHFGTLLSILVVYRKELITVLKDVHTLAMIVIATIPVGVVGLLLKDYVDEAFHSPLIAGCALLATAVFLLTGRWLQNQGQVKGPNEASVSDMSGTAASQPAIGMGTAIAVGLFQAIAIVPGISRSGSTIAAGMACGMKREDAARFSFLIAIPAIGGASVLELRDFVTGEASFSGSPLPVLIGMLVSFVVGVLALRWLIRMVVADRLHLFAFYCLAAGLATIIWQLSLGNS
ncbi:MAG: undecaprenyl-diphosphate phosphatase [Planctomycetaceae bacterium]|nr:undecaprenyl-diphosphate phosphatase [Planctomycetaceae bacterium]